MNVEREQDGHGLETTLPCGASLAEIIATPANEAAATPAVVQQQQRIERPARLLIIGLALGAMAEIMLYQNSLGIGVPLFAVCAIAALLAMGHWENEADICWRNVMPLTATALFFAAMVAVRGGALITGLNIAFFLRLSTLLFGMFAKRDLLQTGIGDLIGMPWRIAGRMFAGALPVIRSVEIPGQDARRQFLMPAVRGLLLATPILVVVIALFSSADARFAEKVGEAAQWLFPADYWDRICRVVFALAVAWAGVGGIAYAVSHGEEPRSPFLPKSGPGFTEAMTVLVLVNAVFVTFVALQFDYLFGGAHRVSALPPSAYTEYVHSGFGQLICVAVISLILVSALCAPNASEALDTMRRRILTGSGAALLVLTLVILFSAAQRMGNYEAAYGATVMRAYVDDFIAMIGAALLWRGVTLYSRGRYTPSFGAGALACLIGFGVAVDLQNPEASAVRKNLARYQVTGKVDNFFFNQSISADAVHDMCLAFRATHGEQHATIGALLRTTLDDLENERHADKWPSWHAGRSQARAELEGMARELPAAKTAPASAPMGR